MIEKSKDLISRAEAIEAVMNTTPFTPAGISAIIESLPSAEAVQGEWIPCSERLPEERGEYLISFHTNFLGDCIDIVRYGKPLMPNDEDYKQRNCFYGTSYDGFDVVCRDVTAWMPLPKPYKGGDDE